MIEKNESDNVLLYLPVPEIFFNPEKARHIVSLEFAPISTPQGQFSGLLFGFYSGNEGDLARKTIAEALSHFPHELYSTAAKQNKMIVGLCSLLVSLEQKYFDKPQNLSSKGLEGETGRGLLTVPFIQPPDIEGLGGYYNALSLANSTGSFNLGLITICSSPSIIDDTIDELFRASTRFKPNQEAIISKMSGDIRRIKVARTF